MPNMSYCRFQNTFADLDDCYEALSEGGELSDSEKRYANSLVELCLDIAREVNDGAYDDILGDE